MKILVTGGLGYIGSHTVAELYRHGHQAVIIDDLSNSSRQVLPALENLVGTNIPFYQLDILNQDGLARVFEQEFPVDGIIHFAAKKAVNESLQKPLIYFENNITGLLNIVRCVEDFNVNNLVFLSICTV